MKKLLYIDACVNRDISRTERLAQALLKEMNKNGECDVGLHAWKSYLWR